MPVAASAATVDTDAATSAGGELAERPAPAAPIFSQRDQLAAVVKTVLSPRYASPRRLAYSALFGGLYTTFLGASRLAQRLDHFLYPDLADTRVEEPVFIVATPRCGTTFLHKLLGFDTDRFSYYRLYQTLVPSVAYDRGMAALGRLDERLGRPFGRLIGRIDDVAFNRWTDIHPTGLGRAEEDETLFVYTLLTPTIYMLVPFPGAVPDVQWVDDMPEEVVDRLARYYRDGLKRHVYAAGGRQALVKNVHIAGRMDVTERAFPDARTVHLVRHPYETIPSALSLFYSVWQAHSPDIRPGSDSLWELARMFCGYYRSLVERGDRIADPSRYLTIRYEDLIPHPARTVREIYDRFGYTPSDAFLRSVDEEVNRARGFKSRHEYSLEGFGLSREFVYRELGDLFDRFGYAR